MQQLWDDISSIHYAVQYNHSSTYYFAFDIFFAAVRSQLFSLAFIHYVPSVGQHLLTQLDLSPIDGNTVFVRRRTWHRLLAIRSKELLSATTRISAPSVHSALVKPGSHHSNNAGNVARSAAGGVHANSAAAVAGSRPVVVAHTTTTSSKDTGAPATTSALAHHH